MTKLILMLMMMTMRIFHGIQEGQVIIRLNHGGDEDDRCNHVDDDGGDGGDGEDHQDQQER